MFQLQYFQSHTTIINARKPDATQPNSVIWAPVRVGVLSSTPLGAAPSPLRRVSAWRAPAQSGRMSVGSLGSRASKGADPEHQLQLSISCEATVQYGGTAS